MAKLTQAALAAAALLLAGTGTAMAQDTSYTRPAPVDTSIGTPPIADTTVPDTADPGTGPVTLPDSTITDSASDTLRTDLPSDSAAAATPTDVNVPKREDGRVAAPDSTSP